MCVRERATESVVCEIVSERERERQRKREKENERMEKNHSVYNISLEYRLVWFIIILHFLLIKHRVNNRERETIY